MNYQELERKIKAISLEKGIAEQAIINGILADLEVKYSPKQHGVQDLVLIGKIKKKIIDKLYNSPRERITVNRITKYDELFDLNQVEMNLLESAWEQLESSGDVYSLMYEIGLTEQGIRNCTE